MGSAGNSIGRAPREQKCAIDWIRRMTVTVWVNLFISIIEWITVMVWFGQLCSTKSYTLPSHSNLLETKGFTFLRLVCLKYSFVLRRQFKLMFTNYSNYERLSTSWRSSWIFTGKNWKYARYFIQCSTVMFVKISLLFVFIYTTIYFLREFKVIIQSSCSNLVSDSNGCF